MHFEWDERKASANLRKHGVSFDEAKTVFDDENVKVSSDPQHSDDEDRFIALGLSTKFRLLLICHCYRRNDIIRIYSARKATALEAQAYN